ncbi:MAG: VOC family protein [Rhodovibrionaceae bacterium]
MPVRTCNHIALRCRDAQETADFYTKYLGLQLTIADREVQFRGKPCQFLHIFLKMADGNYLAFFDLPEFAPAQKDPNTPAFAQHIAFQVDSDEEVEEARRTLEANGVEVDGPITRPPFHSIYFADPNGHRLEITSIAKPIVGRYEDDEGKARKSLDQWNAEKSEGFKPAAAGK